MAKKRQISKEELRDIVKNNAIVLKPGSGDSTPTVKELKQLLNDLPENAMIKGDLTIDDTVNNHQCCGNCGDHCTCDNHEDKRSYDEAILDACMQDAGLTRICKGSLTDNGDASPEELNWEMNNLHPCIGMMTENVRFNNEDMAQYIGNMAYTTAKTVLEYLTQSQCHMADTVYHATLTEMCRIVEENNR